MIVVYVDCCSIAASVRHYCTAFCYVYSKPSRLVQLFSAIYCSVNVVYHTYSILVVRTNHVQ